MSSVDLESVLYGGGGGSIIAAIIGYIIYRCKTSSCRLDLGGRRFTINLQETPDNSEPNNSEPKNENVNPMPRPEIHRAKEPRLSIESVVKEMVKAGREIDEELSNSVGINIVGDENV